MEKLSSGLRINRASDDAAGLAISEVLKADVRALEQAARNAGDGISLVQTAEGTLNEVSDIIIRMKELAVQSRTGTLVDADRAYLNAEYSALTEEINRIGWSSSFNGIPLFHGTAGTVNIQLTAENLNAANARVRDVDVAAETSQLARQQILQQAGLAILSQANQGPQLALSVLG